MTTLPPGLAAHLAANGPNAQPQAAPQAPMVPTLPITMPPVPQAPAAPPAAAPVPTPPTSEVEVKIDPRTDGEKAPKKGRKPRAPKTEPALAERPIASADELRLHVIDKCIAAGLGADDCAKYLALVRGE